MSKNEKIRAVTQNFMKLTIFREQSYFLNRQVGRIQDKNSLFSVQADLLKGREMKTRCQVDGKFSFFSAIRFIIFPKIVGNEAFPSSGYEFINLSIINDQSLASNY